jgi:hypothetical protein
VVTGKSLFSLLFGLLFISAFGLRLVAAEDSPPPPVEKPTIITAQEWGSEPDPIPDDRRHRPRFITIHHAGVTWTEDDEPVRRLRGLQAWGKRDRNWPDIPYHFMIAPDGRVFEGRSLEYEPETNTNYDVRGHIGVHLWGNFGEQRVSREQLESAVRLIAWLSQEHEIPTETIRGHMDHASTGCPGKDLYRYIEQSLVRQWVDQALAGEDPDVELLPPLPDGPLEMIPQPAATRP